MSATKYTFSISQDFPNHKVATDRLTSEIQASVIIIALDRINTAGDVCDIWFKDELSSDDQTILASVVHNHSGEPLPQNQTINTNIKSSEITLGSQIKGFQDLTGHNFYKPGGFQYFIKANTTSIFCEKFSSTLYICGGGYKIPEYEYVAGVKTEQKPERGDYVVFDMVDIDNITGYGKKANIAKVARASNVATITTSASHTFAVGEKVCVNCTGDSTFTDMEEVITGVPDNTHITYANTGDDMAEKDATGTVGKIVVLAPFVPKDMVWPGKEWECNEGDAKAIPPGIYLRFRYVSVGSTDVYAYVWYNMRT